jgi:two-component system chemotaxis response regulator CheB
MPCLVVAASTGGPAALLQIVPQLPADFRAAMVIVQHMPAPFTTQLAYELDERSAIAVREVASGERLLPGTAYVCPGAYHLTFDRADRVLLRPATRSGAECPSANLAMTSAADVAGTLAVGVVLTGMGRDGAAGVQAIKRAGGKVIAQDASSALVNGMPHAAIETGCVDVVADLDNLAPAMLSVVGDLIRSDRTVRHAS